MHRFHIHFATDPDDPVPPIAELPTIEGVDPQKAVEAMLAAGRYKKPRCVASMRLIWSRSKNLVEADIGVVNGSVSR